jgi:hypothetical protein
VAMLGRELNWLRLALAPMVAISLFGYALGRTFSELMKP